MSCIRPTKKSTGDIAGIVKRGRDLPAPASRAPRAYLCVYRQIIPLQQRLLKAAAESATEHEDVAQLLTLYKTGSAYDWGDDPSFFSATYHQGSAAHAGWGICRRDVREKLDRSDLVIFFCARSPGKGSPVDYLFVGYGTIGERIDDRRQIWSEQRLAPYRHHLNIFVRYNAAGTMQRHERFKPGHPDLKVFKKLASSPYLIFDPLKSQFNALNPLLVATAAPGEKNETWHLDRRPKVRRLHRFLFEELGIARHLRTSATGYSHRHVNLGRLMENKGLTTEQVGMRLSEFLEPQ